jgi:RnfABCDGE-type electron transport complex G subunit
MNLSSRMIVVLTAVGFISGSLLAVVGMLTKERIAYNKQQEIEAAIIQVVPGTHSSRIIEHNETMPTVYECRNEAGEILGYAVYASGTGFQDIIALMFGTDPELTKLNSLAILEQKETPGLGAKITDRVAFLQFWDNKDLSQELELRKPAVPTGDLGFSEINTITGATISSKKVLEIVNASLEKLRRISIKQEEKSASEEKDGS